MKSDTAPGFLVPDDLENSLVPAGGQVPFQPQRQRPPGGEALISRDPVMIAVVQRAQRIAKSDASVLVQGESGTGKEVIARYIHRNSPRAGGPFIAVNCAAIPEQLLESELFGHERGAFSGALGQRIGKLEAAQNGTILLDEISEMDRRLQAKLLRALQEREIDRIGGRAPIRLNVRIIATTNRDLEQEVARQTFREDLYFRLNVVAVHLPGLRERPSDIAALAEHFIEKYRWETGRTARQLSSAAIAALVAHDWPGNVRELENTIHRALVLTTETVIGVKALEIGPSSGWAPRSETGNANPRSETGNANPRSETGNANPRSETGNWAPRSESGNWAQHTENANWAQRPETANSFPRPDAANTVPRSGAASMDPASDTGDFDPRSETINGDPRPDAGYNRSRSGSSDYGPRSGPGGVVLRSETAKLASAFIGRPLHLMERDVIIGTLQLTGGNRTRAAVMLGLSIRALRNKITLYAAQGIEVPPSSAAKPSGPEITTPGVVDPEGVDPDMADPEGADPEGVDPEGADPEGVDPERPDPERANPEGADPEITGPGRAAADTTTARTP